MGGWYPPGLSDEKAARMMTALRNGQTLRFFAVKAPRLDAYFKAHPEYASEALPLIKSNAKAARLRKGERRRTLTHCKHGHSLADAWKYLRDGYWMRSCRRCEELRIKRPTPLAPADIEKVKAALRAGANISQITHGNPVGGGRTDRSLIVVNTQRFYRGRLADPEFDRFVLDISASSRERGKKIRWSRYRSRIQTAAKREEATDYYKIQAMLPANFPDRDDVVSRIFEALLDGSLRREDVQSRVKFYTAEHNRLFPTKYAKFGNSPLVSLDERLFEDGSATRADTITRGFWD